MDYLTKVVLIAIVVLGCGEEKNYFDITKSSRGTVSHSIKISTSKYINGQLRINGTCGEEGDVLLIMPATEGDDRIIGSTKCSKGRYEIINSTFGRPPCEVLIEYGNGKFTKARVEGADIYCD